MPTNMNLEEPIEDDSNEDPFDNADRDLPTDTAAFNNSINVINNDAHAFEMIGKAFKDLSLTMKESNKTLNLLGKILSKIKENRKKNYERMMERRKKK